MLEFKPLTLADRAIYKEYEKISGTPASFYNFTNLFVWRNFVVAKYDVTTLDTILLFTNLGNYVYLPVQNIPECRLRDMGRNVSVLATIFSGVDYFMKSKDVVLKSK